MRKIIYKAERKDGTIFETTSYAVATEKGSHIVETYLIPVSEYYLKTEELKKFAKEVPRIEKILGRKLRAIGG